MTGTIFSLNLNDEDEDEDMEKAPIPLTQPPKQDVLVEERVKESPTLELEGSISWQQCI